MILVSGFLFAQKKSTQPTMLLLLQQSNHLKASFNFTVNKSVSAAPLMSVIYLAPDFYANQLGFFCRQEIKMDKITKIPFRFRLGSVDDCNRLERKNK